MTTSSYNHPLYLNDDEYYHETQNIESLKKNMSHHGPMVELYGDMEYTYVPELHRDRVRTIIKFFGDLHKDKRSIKSFEESNIVFHRGEMKFYGLKFNLFEKNLPDKDKQKDMELLHKVIENLFSRNNPKNYTIPTPIHDLLETIENYRDIEDSNYAPIESVLCNHLGILCHKEVVDVIKNFHDKAIKHGDDKTNYEDAVSKMIRRDEYKEDFTWRFCSPSSSSSSLPRMELVKKCFHHFGNKAKYKGGNGEILRYCANMAKHLPEHIEKYTGSPCTYKDVELTIMPRFDEELLSFQLEIFRNGLAHHFLPAGLTNPATNFNMDIPLGEISSRLDHPRYLNEEDSSDTKIESMNEYMSRVGVPIVETCQVPAGNPRDRYTFVQELHRSHLKIIVEFICDLHEKNLSLDGSFQVSNIVFLRDELKFCGLKFAHRLQDEDRQRDLRFLHHVIKNLVQTYNKGDNGQFPTPINNLLSVIEKYREHEDASGKRIEHLLPYHLAIQSHETLLALIKRFHANYAMLDGEDKAKYDKAVSEMDIRDEYKVDWTRSYYEALSLSGLAGMGPAQLCFHYQPFPTENGSNTSSEGVRRPRRPSKTVNRHMLKTCRILAEHLHLYMGEKWTKKDIELTIMPLFGKELLSFQRWASIKRIILHFIPDYLYRGFAG